MMELAYVNGTFGPIAEAKVSIEDRGFQFGDAVYEVIASYHGELFQFDAHLRRLRGSAAGIGLEFDFDAYPLESVIVEGLERTGLRDATVYIQITRGVAPRCHVVEKTPTPTVVMTFKPRVEVPEDLRKRGIRAMTILDQRWANCFIKAVTLLPNVLARQEALRRGYDDAIFVTATGEVRECVAANLFIVEQGRITIPPRTASILHGVRQAFVIECAAELGFTVEERAFDVETMCRADEVLMSSTAIEVLGVTRIDGRTIGDGKVGPITKQLYAELCRCTRGLVPDLAPVG
ncbi:MAG: aminotransferase class IV [Planctomycetes bacterium]|nr:aminotransferase class IV [Planctomycetota bacterium]